jgi:WD40 repeat protein
MKGVMNKEDADVTLESPRIEGPGTVIGRYKLLELIGEGGMGLVYLAEQQEPIRRRAALKIVKLGMDTKQVIARFEAEKQMLALLDHPNIARVYDAGTTETGRPYFVMEYVKGQSITEYCDQHKTSIEDRLKLFRQVCEGVQYAHQKGIIHRDIKPSNILVTVEGDRAVPKIIDFGIAKAVTQQLTEQTLFTQQGQLLGTPEYMSPEQTDLATQDIDTRSDIYSLGVVLYQLLAGVQPFGRESFEKGGFAEIQRVIQEVDPPLPSTALTRLGDEAKKIAERRNTQVVPLARRLHRELEWIPLKAMRKERVRRYRSASELADDIQNYLKGNPLIAGPETAIYRVKKFVRRHAGSVATIVLVSAAIVLGLVVSTAMYFRAERMRVQAEQAREQEFVARTKAEQAENVAQERAEDYRQSLYVNRINLADTECREGNVKRVRELLDACPNDLRGWEWHRLNYISDQSLMTLRGHTSWVYCIAISPDGKRIVSGGGDGTIKIWDAATGADVMALRGHLDTVHSVVFSPDGKRLVSGSWDKTIKVWDVASGVELMTLRGDGAIWSIAISSDGKRIISGGAGETIKVWDTETGEELRALRGHESIVFSLAFSPDGKHIVSGGDNMLKVWDSVSGIELMTLHGHKQRVTSVSFSPDGKHIVSGDENGMVKVWDAATGAEMRTLRGHDDRIRSVVFSPDGRFIVSGCRDNTVRVWDVISGDEVKNFRGHEDFVTSIAFTPDGKQIVSGSSDNTIKLWDITIDHEATKLLGHSGTVYSVSFSPDGKHIVSGGEDSTIKIWDAATGTNVMALRGHLDAVHSVVFSKDGKHLVSGSWDKTVRLWDTVTGAEILTLRGHEAGVRSVAFRPDGKSIISAGNDTTIRVWDAETGEELKTLRGHKWIVFSVAFSPDGKRIVSGGRDNMVRVWDSVSGVELITLQGHKGWVTSVSVSPDGKYIISGDEDGMVKVWDAATGAEMRTLRGHDGQIKSVAFSPDGKRIVSGSSDATIKVWDFATGAELMALRRDKDEWIYSLSFSSDGKTIVAGAGNAVVLWESEAPAIKYEPRKIADAARKIVEELYQKYGHYYEVIDKLKADKTLDEAIHKLALQIANSKKWEDAEKLNRESWEVVYKWGQDVEVYRAALKKVEKAIRMEPDNPYIPPLMPVLVLGVAQYRAGAYENALMTLTKAQADARIAGDLRLLGWLGAAQYRAGKYEDTIRTLTEAQRGAEEVWTHYGRDVNEPGIFSFIAMAHHKMGRAEEAKAALDKLRTLLKDERYARFAQDEEEKSLLAEAEKLIEGEK